MSKSKKIQFLAEIQECCRTGSDDPNVETLARAFSRDTGIPLQETLLLKDPRKRTILHYVCRSSSSIDLVGSLLEWFPDLESRRAALKQKDKEGLTCLMMAVQHSSEQAERRVLQMLQAAPKLGLVRSKAGATALHYAAGAGATRSTLQALWEHGKVALQTFALQGGTPLHWACSSSKDIPETIEALIECGANVNVSRPGDENNTAIPTPLALALAVGQKANVCVLLGSSEISVDRILSGGKTTFLHMAVGHNMPDALELILAKLDQKSKDILLLCKDKEGLTPMDVAIQQKNTACVELLRASESPLSSVDEKLSSTVAETESPKSSMPKQDEVGAEESSSDSLTHEEKQALDRWAQLEVLPEASQESAEIAIGSKTRGNEYFQRKEWQHALDCYSDAIESNSKDGRFYANRSACQIQLGNPREALIDAILARKLRPKWTKPYYRQAVALSELQRHQDAAITAYEGLRLEPSNVELQKLLRNIVKQGRQAFQKTKDASKDV